MKGKSLLFAGKGAAAGDLLLKSSPMAYFNNIGHRPDIDPNGYLDVVAHGTSRTIQIEHNGKLLAIDWRELSKIIKRDKSKKGKPIRLLSCNTGADPNGFAQSLANKLGVKVLAPNKLLWSWPNGTHVVAGRSASNKNAPDLMNKGEFVEFIPGGNIKWKK